VAFVATVYGVASANLFFLPAANKIRARLARSVRMKELTLEGVCNIAEGLNPKLIRLRLDAYAKADIPGKPEAAKAKAAPSAAPLQAESSEA